MKQIGKGPEAFCFRAFQFYDVVQRLALRRFVKQKTKGLPKTLGSPFIY